MQRPIGDAASNIEPRLKLGKAPDRRSAVERESVAPELRQATQDFLCGSREWSSKLLLHLVPGGRQQPYAVLDLVSDQLGRLGLARSGEKQELDQRPEWAG